MLLTNAETKGTAFQHALPGEILTESFILRLASFRRIEGCHLPIKGIGRLSTTRLIEYMYIKAKKDVVGFKPYHVDNNALWDSNHVAKYYWIKIGVIKLYDNLRLWNKPENLTSLNQATLVYAIHWPQSRGGLHNPECIVAKPKQCNQLPVRPSPRIVTAAFFGICVEVQANPAHP